MSDVDRRRHAGELSQLRDLQVEFDQRTFDRLVDAFTLDAFHSLDRLLKAADDEQRAAASHRLAGIMAQYGFRHVARHVEEYGSLRPGSADCRQAIARLRFEICTAARTLRKIGARPGAPPTSPKTGI